MMVYYNYNEIDNTIKSLQKLKEKRKNKALLGLKNYKKKTKDVVNIYGKQ